VASTSDKQDAGVLFVGARSTDQAREGLSVNLRLLCAGAWGSLRVALRFAYGFSSFVMV
jgi:hypothetical protein